MAVYGNSIPQYENALSMKASKQRVVMKVLDLNRSPPSLSTADNIAVNKSIAVGLQGITANRECKLNAEVKQKLVEFLVSILVRCDANITASVPDRVDPSIVELEQLCMDIIINILRNDFEMFDVGCRPQPVRRHCKAGRLALQRSGLETQQAAEHVHASPAGQH